VVLDAPALEDGPGEGLRMPEKILVRATNWVGDVVMATPALAAIRDNFKDARISVLIRPPLQELLEGDPAVDEFILYDKKEGYSGPAGIARLAKELRGRKFDRAILLQNAFEAALIAFLSKIPVRMGYNTDGRGILLTKGIKIAEETRRKHQVYYYLDLLNALGFKTKATALPKLYLNKEDSDYAARVLKEHGIRHGDTIVGINPGAQYGIAKKWYPERFGQVADRLSKDIDAKILIFGGPGDVMTAKTVEASMHTPAVNLCGKTGIRGLMALTKKLGLFITNDTGPMHVSAALGTPTLAVFGSTDHITTGPSGPNGKNAKSVRVVRDPIFCSPCLKRKCPLKSYRCMEQVTAEQVLKAAKEMLEVG